VHLAGCTEHPNAIWLTHQALWGSAKLSEQV
jgi:hypothetical protein